MANLDVHFSSETDMWSTPQDFFDKLNALWGFTLDACAIAENAKCKAYFSPEQDGLIQDWKGVVYCNPPYGREVGQWVEKAYNESLKPETKVVMLLPARTDTRWFHDFIYNKPGVAVEFIKGRLKFGNSSNAAPFPSMVVAFDRYSGVYYLDEHLAI